MPDGLYEHDALAWSEQQADLLRRLAAGERLNAAVDWPNVIEEIETVGRSELRACRGALTQALIHLLKLHAWPNSRALPHWRGEVAGFLVEANQDCSPSMTQRVDLADLYQSALYRMRAKADDSGAPRPLPDVCPFLLEDLVVKFPNPDDLLAKLSGAAAKLAETPHD